eukprot:10345217-Lingulodinium_polyedra.AAC.1
MLLDCLPKEDGPLWSLQQALEKVDTVGQTNLCRLSGETGARRVATLHEVLANMEAGAENVAEDWE